MTIIAPSRLGTASFARSYGEKELYQRAHWGAQLAGDAALDPRPATTARFMARSSQQPHAGAKVIGANSGWSFVDRCAPAVLELN